MSKFLRENVAIVQDSSACVLNSHSMNGHFKVMSGVVSYIIIAPIH